MLNLISLFSSSKGNCTYVCSESTKILVDIGVSTKRLVETLISIEISPEEIQGILKFFQKNIIFLSLPAKKPGQHLFHLK